MSIKHRLFYTMCILLSYLRLNTNSSPVDIMARAVSYYTRLLSSIEWRNFSNRVIITLRGTNKILRTWRNLTELRKNEVFVAVCSALMYVCISVVQTPSRVSSLIRLRRSVRRHSFLRTLELLTTHTKLHTHNTTSLVSVGTLPEHHRPLNAI
jgi:hypothetical protein